LTKVLDYNEMNMLCYVHLIGKVWHV